MPFALLVVGDLGHYEFLFELSLELLRLGSLFKHFLKLLLVLCGFLSQGVDLVGDLHELGAGFVESHSEFVKDFLGHFSNFNLTIIIKRSASG